MNILGSIFKMENLAVLLLLLWIFQANGDFYSDLDKYYFLIDCGVSGNYTENYFSQSWYPDTAFVDSGKTKKLGDTNTVPQFMTTLRYFPKNDINCYKLPLKNTEKYLFRAGFYYANYDGKSAPPVFDLVLGGQLWATVNTSSATNTPIFHELMYMPKYWSTSVCLRRRSGTPFISSLEATYLEHDENYNETVYTKMKNGTAYHLHSRFNFGSDQLIVPWSLASCEEELNRYWIPQEMGGYENVKFDAILCHFSGDENDPPSSLLATAIAAPAPQSSIYLPITFNYSQSAYIVLYFSQNLPDHFENPNTTRFMDIYVDGVIKANINFYQPMSTQVVTLYPVWVNAVANLTIAPANGTVLPPLLNAIEIFIATDLDEQPTSFAYRISSSLMLLLLCLVTLFFVLG